MTRRAALSLLAAFPGALAVAVLVASPGRLFPGLPRYRYEPLPGDAYGFYYCVRELLASTRRDALPLFVALVVGTVLVAYVRRRTAHRAYRLLALMWALGLIAAVLAEAVRFTGAAQLGWSLVWSVPLLPLRLVGVSITPGLAFAFGLTLSILCNAVTVVAAYLLGERAGLRPRIAMAGAAFVAFWPLLSLLTGSHAARNGSWQIWLGLSLYTEPLSTALVVVALVLVLSRPRTDLYAVAAGALLGLATLVRISNVLIVACVIVGVVLYRHRRAALLVAAGAAAWAPAAILFWPKSYPKLKPPIFPAHPLALHYAGKAWNDSYLWHPAVLVALVPLAVVGVRRARADAAALLWACVVATAAFYSFYELTPMHPRFLFVVLPIVLLFWAAGADVVIAAARGLYDRAR